MEENDGDDDGDYDDDDDHDGDADSEGAVGGDVEENVDNTGSDSANW